MIELTNIWKINNTLVIADSIEEAINVYKNHEGYSSIDNIERVTNTFNGCAIIDTPESLDSFINRASKWLKETLIDNKDNLGYKIVSSFDSVNLEEFIEMFKEDMKNDD